MILRTITLYGNPATKKNSGQIVRLKNGMTRIIPSKKYTEYENDCIRQLGLNSTPIDEPINVKCIFYRGSRRKVDLSNLISAVSDMLVKANVIADDNRDVVAGNDGSRVYYDKENPRTEITIETMEGYERWKTQ